MTYIITKDVSSKSVDVFAASPEQVQAWYDTDALPASLMGWVIETRLDMSKVVLSGDELLELFNASRDNPLVKFPNKAAGYDRTYEVLGTIALPFDELLNDIKPAPAPKAKKAKSSTTRKGKNGLNFVDIKPAARTYECRAGTKQALIVDMLAEGTSKDALVSATGWKEGSVISALYYDVYSKKGYGVKSELSADETFVVYTLTYPDGQTAPLPHKVSKASK
jgi:hypothetical protein